MCVFGCFLVYFSCLSFIPILVMLKQDWNPISKIQLWVFTLINRAKIKKSKYSQAHTDCAKKKYSVHRILLLPKIFEHYNPNGSQQREFILPGRLLVHCSATNLVRIRISRLFFSKNPLLASPRIDLFCEDNGGYIFISG